VREPAPTARSAGDCLRDNADAAPLPPFGEPIESAVPLWIYQATIAGPGSDAALSCRLRARSADAAARRASPVVCQPAPTNCKEVGDEDGFVFRDLIVALGPGGLGPSP
jgi:hypothetical protein